MRQTSREGEDNAMIVFGPDASLPLGSNAEFNAQYLRRLDDNPFFLVTGDEDTTVDAGFAEVVWWPKGRQDRWALTGLYNHVAADAEVVSLRLGEQADAPGFLRRYRSASGGVNYLLQRNIRALGEIGWDLEDEAARFTVGVIAAF